MIKGIIFDYDDTLIMTSEAKFAAHKFTAKKFYNIDLTDTDIKKVWGIPFTQFIKKLYREVESVEKILEKYYTVGEQFPIRAYKDSKKTIKQLKKHFHLGIVTAANSKLVKESMKTSDLDETDFLYIQTEEDTTIHKPDPKVYDPILRKFKQDNIEKHELICVGDHLFDYHAAKGAGIDFYGIADRTTSKKEFDKLGVKTIRVISDLIDALKLN